MNNNFDNIIGKNEKTLDKAIFLLTKLEPLLYKNLSLSEAKEYKKNLCYELGISDRTLRRYLLKAKNHGTSGLVKNSRKDHGSLRKYNPALTKIACDLLEENPYRSVRDVLALMKNHEQTDIQEASKLISVSTLYQKIIASGFNFAKRIKTQPKRYLQFEAPYAHSLWQGDAADGIWLPHPNKKGQVKKTYLFAWIDDFSRKIIYAKYYFDEQLPRLEDCFRNAVLRWGKPERLYCDNGSVYISRHFTFIVEQLGIKKIHHKPYHSWSKGKIERFNQRRKKFQKDAELSGIQTIEELNSMLDAWIEVEYHSVVHGETGETPNKRFANSVSNHPPKRIDNIEEFNELFHWRENRVIDKYGRISLHKNEYRISEGNPGDRIEVRFSPFDLELVKVYRDGKYKETVKANKLSVPQLKEIPEETKASQKEISKSSVIYFNELRRQYNELVKNKPENQISFINLKGEINVRKD